MSDEVLYLMCLSCALPYQSQVQRQLLEAAGSAKTLYVHRRELRDIVPDTSERLASIVAQLHTHLPRAEEEAAFAEKNHMPPIRLNEEATQLLQSYYWYGNVRQLKNVAERVSIIESERNIDAETLKDYLPQNERVNTLAKLDHVASSGDAYLNERELLYKVLFDMKRDMNEMREQLNGLMHQPAPQPTFHPATPHPTHETVVAEEVIPEAANSISDLEKEAIRRALDKSGGNRKEAAEILGFSEGTLYRKIKEYGL